MITGIITVVAALAISGLIILIVAARRAPVGFEDEAGFHANEPRSRPEHPIAATIRVR